MEIFIMAKYYSDEELLDKIRYLADSGDSYERVSELVEERFAQKDKQREHINARLQEAANIIGHNTISECMMYE
jgi:hypothetical protein